MRLSTFSCSLSVLQHILKTLRCSLWMPWALASGADKAIVIPSKLQGLHHARCRPVKVVLRVSVSRLNAYWVSLEKVRKLASGKQKSASLA